MDGEPIYKFVLKNEKRSSYQRISNFVIIANVLVFLYLLLFPADKYVMTVAGAALISILIYYVVKYFFYRPQLFREGLIFGVYHIFIIGYLAMEFYIPAIAAFLLNLLLNIATREYTVIFYNNRINYNAIPVKELKWSELNHVILKDGLLTLDMKSNRILQEELDAAKNNVDEIEFNEFCRQHLSK